MKLARWIVGLSALACTASAYAIGLVQVTSTPPSAACSAGVLDTYAASPGAWTFGDSFRLLRIAYAGSAKQLQRTTDNATQNVGFTVCDFDTTTAASFCSTSTSLAVTTSSARVAYPSGATLFVWNTSTSAAVYYKQGNSSVTAAITDTLIGPGQIAAVTVGANTNIAAITAVVTSTIRISNCGVRTSYDQVNSNNLVQTTQANQTAYFDNCSSNNRPCQVSTPTSFMTAADNAAYKTAVIHQFSVVAFGVADEITGVAPQRVAISYPSTGSATGDQLRWGLFNGPYSNEMSFTANASGTANSLGLGATFRSIPYVYDYNTTDLLFYYNNVQFAGSGTPGSITYPTAVGMYYGGDPAGKGSNGLQGFENLLASAKQTARASIVTNQATYFGISTPASTTTGADGFTWNIYQLTSDAPLGPGNVSVNGNTYAVESAGQQWSQWVATNVKTAGVTSLGDLYRFEIRQFDDGLTSTNRTELDGFPSTMSLDTLYRLSYCWMVETGSDVVSYAASGGQANWNITGQAHGSGGPVASPFYFKLNGHTLSILKDDVVVYNSGSSFVTFGSWIDIFVKVKKSTSGTTDSFDVYFNSTLVYTCSGACFGTATGQLYWKYGIYRGDPFLINGTQAFRYGNMQLTTANIDAQIATPLDHPTHNFLFGVLFAIRRRKPANDNARAMKNAA